MEEEVGRKFSHDLEDLVACENWHAYRHGRVYVFSMPSIRRNHNLCVKIFHYITN
jgi:hypothetical protein